jgi:hypothetical protein
MRTLQQSPRLREQFQSQVTQSKAASQEKVTQRFKGSFLESLVPIAHEINQFRNSVKGAVGESFVSWSLVFDSLPDTWVCFPNALIPIDNKVTEIDRLIVSPNGVFLIEVKNWSGSFAAYRDNWKRREGSRWIPLQNSPTKQSLYHQRCFYKWIRPIVPALPRDFVHAPVVFPSAKWIGAKESSVPVLHGISSLKAFLSQSNESLSLNQVNQIVEAVSQA